MKALLIVDLQNDFLPGGALSVPEGDQVIPVINSLLEQDFDYIVATKDWHPSNHGSFSANHPGRKPGEMIDLNGLDQILWPVHCVQDTPGSEFAPALHTDKISQIFYKGTDPEIDSYSAFFDNGHLKATGLGDSLKEKGVTDIYVGGLATDYCIKFSVLDALKLGFNVHVITDAIRGIDLQEGDCDLALLMMREAGAQIIGK